MDQNVVGRTIRVETGDALDPVARNWNATFLRCFRFDGRRIALSWQLKIGELIATAAKKRFSKQ
jgi:hypothetical protein